VEELKLLSHITLFVQPFELLCVGQDCCIQLAQPFSSIVQVICEGLFEAEAYRSESSIWFNRSACSGTVLEVKMAAFKNTDVSIYGTSQHDRPEVSDFSSTMGATIYAL
jgi:hypothetical protein